MKRVLAIILLVLVALYGQGISPTMAQSGDVTITKIRIEGAQRIDPATVLSYSSLSAGDTVSRSSLNRAVGRLFATNLFEDVSIGLDGTVVVIEVLENPIINRISIEGNDVLPDEQLLEFIDIKDASL